MPLLTSVQSGIGITLSNKAVGGSTYALVGELKDDCEFSGLDTTVIPLPLLAAVNLAKAPGRIDSGDFTGSVYLVPGEATSYGLVALAQARTMQLWQVQLPDGTSAGTGTTVVFTGFISNYKPGNFTGEDAPTADFTIAISGVVTFTLGT